ncbi:MAG: hypothetical protein ACMG6E_02330, partial [Candidatus Roizmanbacteria bacterium]
LRELYGSYGSAPYSPLSAALLMIVIDSVSHGFTGSFIEDTDGLPSLSIQDIDGLPSLSIQDIAALSSISEITPPDHLIVYLLVIPSHRLQCS